MEGTSDSLGLYICCLGKIFEEKWKRHREGRFVVVESCMSTEAGL